MLAQRSALESGLGLLATLGNNAPFVGLFGTVVGIVGAFTRSATARRRSWREAPPPSAERPRS